MPPANEAQNSLLNYFVEFFINDWFASLPILFCLIVMLGVIIERSIYYSRNHQKDLASFIRRLQGELEKGNFDGAVALSRQAGGLIGLMTEEGLRLVRYYSKNFTNAFDISATLYIRDLERRLSALATIGATAPFLGLFGTVVGVIVTLKALGEKGQSAEVVIGVAKALIATGFGLIVAIIAVVMNNYFNSIVRRFESDFQVIKLTLIDFTQLGNTKSPISSTAAQVQVVQQSPVSVIPPIPSSSIPPRPQNYPPQSPYTQN